MKRVLPLLAALVLLLSVPAYAAEDDGPTDDDTSSGAPADIVQEEPSIPSVSADSTETEKEVTVNVTIQQPEAAESAGDASTEDFSESISDVPEDNAQYRTFTVISPNDTEAVPDDGDTPTMAGVVASVLGEYQRKTQTVTELDSDGNILAMSTEYVPGLAGLDYHWLAGAGLFAVTLYSLFRLLGGLLKL